MSDPVLLNMLQPLTEPYLTQIRAGLQKIAECERQYYEFLGRALETRRNGEALREHLRYVMEMARVSMDCPEGTWRLNAEGTALVGQVPFAAETVSKVEPEPTARKCRYCEGVLRLDSLTVGGETFCNSDCHDAWIAQMERAGSNGVA